jgi:hypothetical protein
VSQSCPRGVDFVEWVLSINRSLVKIRPTLHYRGPRSPVIFVGVVAVIVRGESSTSLRLLTQLLLTFVSLNSLAIKNTEDNGTTKKDPASSDLLNDGEQ